MEAGIADHIWSIEKWLRFLMFAISTQVKTITFDKKTGGNVRQAVPFFHVSNMEGSRHYYVLGLGFRMAKKWIDEGKPRWRWLEIGDAAWMLEEFRTEGHNSWKPSRKVGEARVDLLYVRRCSGDLSPSVGARNRRNPFIGQGLWVVSFSDPDGYPSRFRKPYGCPEETEYSPDYK
jgi:lactoylglutathione lyase